MKDDKFDLIEKTPNSGLTSTYLEPTKAWKGWKPINNTLPLELTQMLTETTLLTIPVARHETGKKFRKMREEQYVERQVGWLHYQLAHKQITDPSLIKEIKYDLDTSKFLLEFLMMCRSFSATMQRSLPVVMLAVLVTMVMAVCGRYRVSCAESWSEALELFALIINRSGTRKSAFAALLKKPFLDFELEKSLSDAEKEKQKKQNDDILTLDKALQKKAIQEIISRKDFSLERQVQELLLIRGQQADVIAKYKMPVEKNPRLFFEKTSDVSFVKILQEQGESLNCITAEGSFFNSDLMKKNPQYLLSAHDMEPIYYDSRNSGDIAVINPAVSLLLLVQPAKAFKFYKNSDYKEIGLSPRFLSLLETEHDEYGNKDKDEFRTQYNIYIKKIKKLLDAHFTQNPNRTIENIYLSDEAYEHAICLMKEAEKYRESKKYEFMNSFLGKFHGHVVRLAAALHIFNSECDEIKDSKITLDKMIAATELMNVVLLNACHLFDDEELEAYENAKKIVRWLINGSKEANVYEFNSKQLQNGTKIPRDKAEAALKILEKKNLVMTYNDPRTSIIVAVHPYFYTINWDEILAYRTEE